MIKVSRTTYKELRQGDLAPYAENVFKQMNGTPAFSTLQSQVAALIAPLAHFKETLAASLNGGKALTILKNDARKELLIHMDEVALGVENLAKGNVALIVEAGLTPTKDNSLRYREPLEAPQILLLKSNGKPNQLYMELLIPQRWRVRTILLKGSVDGGKTWFELDPVSSTKSTVRDVPGPGWVSICARSVGRGRFRSPWSDKSDGRVA